MRKWCPGPELNRHVPFETQDFKSCASTNFATGACKIPTVDHPFPLLTRRDAWLLICQMNSAPMPRRLREAFAALMGLKGLFILVYFGFSMTLDQTLTGLMESELLNPDGASAIIWAYGGLSFLVGLLTPLVMAFVILSAWRFPHESTFDVAQKHLGYLVKEEMRVMGKSLLWGLLLLIPGLIRFFQCLFVPFVVLLDPQYQKGEVDALQASWVRVKRVWARLLGLFVFFGLIAPLLMTFFDGYRSILEQPLTALPLFLVELTVLIVFQWSVLKTWEKANEPDVSMV